jgi:sigma54-dependent transcription regulator
MASLLIEKFGHKRIRNDILLARDVLDLNQLEAAGEFSSSVDIRLEVWLLDLPRTERLLDDELGIHVDTDPLDATLERHLERKDQTLVLGLVHGAVVAQIDGLLITSAVNVEHSSTPVITGVAAAAAIGMSDGYDA